VHATMGRMPNDHNPPGEISTRLVSFSADSTDPPGVNDYDGFAGAYAAANENNLVNAKRAEQGPVLSTGRSGISRISLPVKAFDRSHRPGLPQGA